MVQSASTNTYPQGQCTWWASQRYWQLTGYYVPWKADAKDWSSQATGYGWSVSSTPQTGDIVCFQPGVQSADSTFGHVGIVEKILGSGSISTSNLNFDGQQQNITDFTFSTGNGVSFINDGQGSVNTDPIPLSGTPATQALQKGNSTQKTTSNSINGTSGDTAVTLQTFCIAVLNRLKNDRGVTNIGGNPAQHTINFMIAWAMQESGSSIKNGSMCTWNPFNTTLPTTDTDSQEQGPSKLCGQTLGIQSYPTQGTGEDATSHTIERNKGYDALWNALATDDENGLGFTDGSIAENVAQGLALWVSGKADVASNRNYIIPIMANAGISNPSIRSLDKSKSTLTGASQDQINKWGSQVIGYYASSQTALENLGLQGVANALNNFANSLQGVGSFFQSMSNLFKDPIRIFKILFGIVLVIVGLVLFVKTMAIPTVKSAVS